MQTTKRKRTTNCPLCLVPYVSVRQHCLKFHQMFNRKELRLVMNYTSGIHTGPLDCPICKCRGRVRLDKHLENVHGEIKTEHYKSIVKAAKQRATLFKLRYLRKSKPDPPMVSRLDLDNLSSSSEDEEDEEEEEEEQQGGERPSSNNPGSSAPGSSAAVSSPATSCAKCSHLKQKVRHLESLLHSPVTTQMPQQTPVRPSPDTPTPSRKKFERLKTKCKGPTPQLENVLNVWMNHIKGCNKRQEENARQRVTHVRNWLIFMADGGIPAVTLPFLQNKERLIEWVNSLKKHAVTTQLIQIGNVRGFIKFLLEAELPQVKVPKKHLHGTLFSLQTLAKTARKELQTHRQAVRLKKSSSLVNPANITAFLTKANKEIPLALRTLEKQKSREALERVYGLLGGLITCITGHRKGVITNLKVEEFAEAEEDELERRIIRVKDHKTKESFGHALIPLMKTEYMWFYRLIYNRHKYPCGKSELVFSNSNGGPFNDILTAFQNCWESFGLPGRPTFSLIRSSISTCVGRSLEENKKGNIRRLMCHSTATAEKFYEADLGFSEAFQTRKDTAAALGSTFQNRCRIYENTEKTDLADDGNSVSQSAEDGEGADKVESSNSKSSEEEEEGHKSKKYVLRRSRLRSDSEAVTRKDTAQAKRKEMAKRYGRDSDSEHTESRDSQSSQEEEEEQKGKKHVLKRARVQSDNQRERKTNITLAKRKKTSKRRLQFTDTDHTESSDSKSSQEEEEGQKGRKRVMKRARVQSESQKKTRKDVIQAKRKKMSTRCFQFSESDYVDSSEGEGDGDEGDVQQEEKKKTGNQEEVSECGTGKSDKRVTQDKDNDAERVEIISSSEEIENMKNTTVEPAQQTAKHDKAKKRPSLSCNPVRSVRKINNLSKSPRTKYRYLQRKGKGCSQETPTSPKQLRVQSCHVVLQRVNTKALDELKRQRQARAKKCLSLQKRQHVKGSLENHKIKNKTGTTEDMTGNQKEDSHQVEVRAGNREHHPADNALRDVQAGDQAGDQEGDSNNTKLQNRDAEDSAAQGDKDNELQNGVTQAQRREGDQGDGAEQTEEQDGDPEEGGIQLGHQEENWEDRAKQAGHQEGDPQNSAAQGDKDNELENGVAQSQSREGDQGDGAEQTEDGDPEEGAIQLGHQEEHLEDRAKQAGHQEGDPQNSSVQTEDQKGGPENCAKQTDDQKGDPADSAVQAGNRKGNTKCVAVQVGDKEGDPDDRARQTGDQEGEPEGDAEQSGEREGDPQSSAVQAEDQKGGPEDCAKQADNQEGDPDDSAVQAGTRKDNAKYVAVQVGEKEGDTDDGARQTGDQEGEPEGDAEQSGEREGDPQSSAVQTEDQKGGPENCAKQADNQEGDPEDSAVHAGTRKDNTKDVAVQVGEKEGDTDDGARQTGDQEGAQEGDVEQSGERGDPQSSAVQTKDQKRGPEDCAKQADNQEGDPENSAVQAGIRKDNTKDVAVQVGEREGDPENCAVQLGEKESTEINNAEKPANQEGDPNKNAAQTGDQEGDPGDCPDENAVQRGHQEEAVECGAALAENQEDGAAQVGGQGSDVGDSADSKGNPEDGAAQARKTGTQKPCFRGPRQFLPFSAESRRISPVTKKSPTVSKKVLGKYQHLMKRNLQRKKKVQQYFSPPQLRVRKAKRQPKET